MILGSHVSFGSEQILGSVKEALGYHANTFMFYTGAPQNTLRKEIDLEKVSLAKKLMEKENINIKNVICHAPYIINLANKKDPIKWDFSINFLEQELKRCETLGISYIVLHPGSAVGLPKEEALNNIIEALNIILDKQPLCQILLETMAGKGSECGSTLEEMEYLFNQTNKRVGFCLDTCHLNDSGVSMKHFDEYLDEFDQKIGLSYIHCIHINDSKNTVGSHKDRHANIGYGTIGFETLLHIIYHEKLKDVPKILETPYVGDTIDSKEKKYPPYRFEIESILSKTFDEHLIKHIASFYNK